MDSMTMTAQQAADKLGISKGLLYKMVHAGQFYPAIRIGKKIMVLKDEFERWVEEQKGKKI